MTALLSLSSVISILIYSLAFALCFMMYGKTGKKRFQYAGTAMFVAVFSSVSSVGLALLGFGYSTHALVFAIILAVNIIEIYLFAKIVYNVFDRAISAAFYIWLCVIIMINGFVSPFPVDLALWTFLAFNISVVILGIFYWESLVRETDGDRQQEAGKYNRVILALVICAIAVLAYSITNLSLFQKVPSRNFMDAAYLLSGLIAAGWLIHFCQQEYEFYTDCSLKEALRAQQEIPENPVNLLASEEIVEGPVDQMEKIRMSYDLTEREAEILQLILSGKSNQEISEALYITVGTVKAHVHSIFGKLEVSRRSQLISRFMELDV